MSKIAEFIKKVINILNRNELKNILNTEIAVSDKMTVAINLWDNMYRDKASWIDEDIHSLNIPASVSSELARLVTIEMKSEITKSSRADFLQAQYDNVLHDIRNITEFACAKGGLMFKPYVSDGQIKVDYIQADNFIPTAFDSSGNITAVIFMDKKYKGDKIYTRLEYHKFENGKYIIKNHAYVSSSENDIGKKISLNQVDEWRDLSPETVLDGMEKPLFSYFRMPMANTVDPTSSLGVSVYSRAVELIKDADMQYSRLLWEFESGERALYVDDGAFLRDKNGAIKFPHKRLYRSLLSNDELFKEWTPTLREQNILNGLNALLRKIEFNVGLAYGTLSDINNVDKTAEEIRSSKQRSYAHVSDIQSELQAALTGLVYAMNVLATLYSLAPEGEYEISFEFDDSIVADRRAEFSEKIQLVSAGIMQNWEFRMWYFGEDEETAKAHISDEFNGVPEI